MLLRRITKHAKDQNWFAVGLDFLIVVVGVFIGLQVSNWNAAANASAREAVILEQLQTEFEGALHGMKAARTDNQASLMATRDVLRAIRNGVKPQDDAEFLRTLNLVGSVNPGSVEPTTLIELLSSGNLSELSSPSLRNALIRYHTSMLGYQTTADVVLQRISEREGGFQTSVYVNPDFTQGDFITKYDWESLQTAREQLQVFFYGKLSIAADFDKLVERCEEVLSELEAAQ